MNSTYREQILTRAIDMIHNKGWSKGQAYGPHGEVCVGIAVNDSLEELRSDGVIPDDRLLYTDVAHDAHLAVLVVVHEITGVRWGGIARWNDYVEGCQSADEAVDTMKRAIDALVETPIF